MTSISGVLTTSGVSLAVLIQLPSFAEAKCPIERYRVEVEVHSSRSSEPIAGARLAVFANGAEAETPGSADTSGATTGPDGKVTHTVAFNTYSGPGILNADLCDAKLRELEILVTHPDYRSRRLAVKPIRMSPSPKTGVRTIVIPPVAMDATEPTIQRRRRSGKVLVGWLDQHRRAAGRVLDAMMEEPFKPVYREHPDLIPPELDRRYLHL